MEVVGSLSSLKMVSGRWEWSDLVGGAKNVKVENRFLFFVFSIIIVILCGYLFVFYLSICIYFIFVYF